MSTIGFIGSGNMAEALIRGLIAAKVVSPQSIFISDVRQERLKELADKYGVMLCGTNAQVVERSETVVLSVKPQIMAAALQSIQGSAGSGRLFISIAAGVRVAKIEAALGDVPIIRVMPNTPALIGEGMTALTCGAAATETDLAQVRKIFDAVGLTVVVKENLMNAVTGLSGSGPAYGFIIIEALSDAGVRMGLSRDIALKLAAQTLLGAAKLCLKGDKHPGELKDMVTSPGGTTIAGIKALEEGKIRATLMAAVEAAALRARELGDH